MATFTFYHEKTIKHSKGKPSSGSSKVVAENEYEAEKIFMSWHENKDYKISINHIIEHIKPL